MASLPHDTGTSTGKRQLPTIVESEILVTIFDVGKLGIDYLLFLHCAAHNGS